MESSGCTVMMEEDGELKVPEVEDLLFLREGSIEGKGGEADEVGKENNVELETQGPET
jgi:hypothetical protein